MIFVDTEEKWQKAFDHQDKLVREIDPNWIPVTSLLRPEKDEWVQLLINDRLNGHTNIMREVLINIGYRKPQGPLRVITAMYFHDDPFSGLPC